MAKTDNKNDNPKPSEIRNQQPKGGTKINLAMEIPSKPIKPKDTPKNNK